MKKLIIALALGAVSFSASARRRQARRRAGQEVQLRLLPRRRLQQADRPELSEAGRPARRLHRARPARVQARRRPGQWPQQSDHGRLRETAVEPGHDRPRRLPRQPAVAAGHQRQASTTQIKTATMRDRLASRRRSFFGYALSARSASSAAPLHGSRCRLRCRRRRRQLPLRCDFQIISPRHSMISWCASCSPMRLHQQVVRRLDAARLVDRDLLGDRQVHRQVQERIRLAALDRVIARDGFVGVEQGVVVFRVLDDPVGGDGVHRRQDFTGALLAVSVAEEAAHVVRGRGEQRWEAGRKR